MLWLLSIFGGYFASCECFGSWGGGRPFFLLKYFSRIDLFYMKGKVESS